MVVYILQNPPPTLENPRIPTEADKKWSRSFHDFVKHCLQAEPKKRPTAMKLLKHRFFDQVPKDPVQLLTTALIDDLPPIVRFVH